MKPFTICIVTNSCATLQYVKKEYRKTWSTRPVNVQGCLRPSRSWTLNSSSTYWMTFAFWLLGEFLYSESLDFQSRFSLVLHNWTHWGCLYVCASALKISHSDFSVINHAQSNDEEKSGLLKRPYKRKIPKKAIHDCVDICKHLLLGSYPWVSSAIQHWAVWVVVKVAGEAGDGQNIHSLRSSTILRAFLSDDCLVRVSFLLSLKLCDCYNI